MKPPLRQSVAGFTLLEMIVVVVIIGILAAIVGPSWLVFLNRQRLNAAQNRALIAIRDAQANAKREKRVWEVCFQQTASPGNQLQYSVHPFRDSTASPCANARWQNLSEEGANTIGILAQGSASLPYKVQFDYNGLIRDKQQFPGANILAPVATPNGEPEPIGKITFAIRNGNTLNSNGSKRCLIVATLIGAIRPAQDDACTP